MASGRSGSPLLVVEDEAAGRALLARLLRSRYPHLRVITAADAEQGLALYRRARPAVVITDIGLPGSSGIDMAARIRGEDPLAEIIAVTAHSEVDLLLEAIRIGISRYLLKPLESEALFGTVDRALERVAERQASERHRQEIDELNRQLASRAVELETANRELDSFSYTVAHDLRTPLATIGTLTELLLFQETQLSYQAHLNLVYIHHEIERLSRLVAAMLAFCREAGKTPEKETTDLGALARQVVARLADGTPAARGAFRIAQGLMAECDPLLMRIVLENLLINAWKFRHRRRRPRVEFGCTERPEGRVFFVADNGIGFGAGDTAELFLPFRRLHDRVDGDGYGIGLATARRIVARHGGALWAEGRPGKGATFYFTL